MPVAFEKPLAQPAQESPWPQEVLDTLFSFGKQQIMMAAGFSWPPTQPGFLDLFSGARGFAKAALRLGCPWVLVVDVKDGPQCDLLRDDVRVKIEMLVKHHVFVHISAAPVCASMSRAITPAVRTKAHPRGIPGLSPDMRRKVQEGNSFSLWLSSIVALAIAMSIPYWVENPDLSFLWGLKEWRKLGAHIMQNSYRLDFCRFSAPWRKRTRIFTDSSLRGRRDFCDGSHTHVILRGKQRGTGINMTHLAEAYPRGLCTVLAWHACKACNYLAGQSCPPGFKHRRIGEAQNPGPRPKKTSVRDPSTLDSVELVRAETSALGERLFSKFWQWLVMNLGEEWARNLFLVPGLMGYMLSAYGRNLYARGDALYSFRHLMVFMQRKHPGFKGFLQPGWDLVNRWEELEPIEHRRPIPAALLRAMVSLSLLWQWKHVAGVLLVAYYGCCRPGEVLAAKRAQLVLPADLGQQRGPCYLRILRPKPGRRGMGRVQHAKVGDSEAVALISLVFRHLDSNEPLYAGSSSAFRLRWDKLLESIGIPKACCITPGGLRAGGTVELYRAGTPILDILWALRLKNVETLQHYLQEIATQITMIDLPVRARVKVDILNDLLPLVTMIAGY